MSLCLPVGITGDQAARHFCRPRFLNLYGLLSKTVRVAVPGTPSSRVPPFVERLWLPAYAICLRTTTRDTRKSVWTSVEGISGEFTMLDCVDELAPRQLNEDWFPAGLDETQAVELARLGILKYVMVQRGQLNKPTVDAVEEVRPYHFAVWVYYYRRRRKFIDLKVLDGYTGKSAGAKMRVSVINALIAARQQRNPAEK